MPRKSLRVTVMLAAPTVFAILPLSTAGAAPEQSPRADYVCDTATVSASERHNGVTGTANCVRDPGIKDPGPHEPGDMHVAPLRGEIYGPFTLGIRDTGKVYLCTEFLDMEDEGGFRQTGTASVPDKVQGFFCRLDR